MEEILNGMAVYFKDNSHERIILKPEFQNGYDKTTLEYGKSIMTLNEIFKEVSERNFKVDGFGFSEENNIFQVAIIDRYNDNESTIMLEIPLNYIGDFLAAIRINNIHIDDFYKVYFFDKLKIMKRYYDAFLSLSDEDKLLLELLLK